MLLTLKAKLQPTEEQRRKLLRTIETFNRACDYISMDAYESRTFNKYRLQHRLYYRIREQHRLPAQLAIRAISKVVESYKVERRRLHVFGRHGAIAYDQRIMSFKGLDVVSLTTVEGRETIAHLVGDYAGLEQRVLRGQADLIYVRKEFYLCLVVEQPEEPPFTPEGILGVDLGIVKLASTSDGEVYSGEDVEAVREHYTRRKAELQRVGSKSAKRHLRRLSGKERRFKRQTNHVISKELVAAAKGTRRAIALEDLRGIRSRVTVRRGQRGRHGKWAFGQLRAFVEYKARVAGVPVLVVEPRDTSRRCSRCGHVERANRRTHACFKCRACGYELNADLNAAENIRWRAEVMQPIVVCHPVGVEFELQAHDLRRES
ncbi:transposase [Candidatus Bathyarchaeota archaeon RBG_13_52_12]|nr:MAG: transposase [Candidatus Bathyarchaeota archaeon RBG_13_52_12]